MEEALTAGRSSSGGGAPEEQQALLRAKSKRSTLRTVTPFILGNELCERLAYYGLATNLVTYLTRVMGGEPAHAAILVAVFEGSCYTTPIIGAVLADSRWGRYKTIMVFSLIYLVGIVLLTLSSMIPDSDPDAETANPLQYGVLFLSLAVISLGTGGIKPNVSAFGADQFNEADPQDRKEKESFFNMFYLAINVGSLIASTVIVYIQDSVSWTLGFAIPGVAMLLAIALFWAGRRGYRHVPPTQSPMTRVVKVVWAAMKNRWTKPVSPDPSVNPNRVVASTGSPVDAGSYHGGQLYHQAMGQNGGYKGYSAVPSGDSEPGNGTPGWAQQPHSGGLNGGGGGPGSNGSGAIVRQNSMHQMPVMHSMSYRWLEDAVTEWQTSQGHLVQTGGVAGFTPKQVEEVKMVIRLLPIFATTVLYWTVYTQMGTLFVQQGNLMARDITWGGQTFRMPSASMSLFNTLSVIVLVWAYDALLEPALKRTRRWRMTLLRRQGWGMLVAAVAMAYAGGLEAWRLSTISGLVPCPPGTPCSTNPDPPDLAGRRLFSVSPGLGDGFGGFAGPYGGAGAGLRRALFQAGAGSAAGLSGYDVAGSGVGGEAWGAWDTRQCMCPNEPAPLSIWWQAPSYLLIGLSEVFTSIGQLEFFYDQAPDVMRSCSMALCLLSTALGSYLAGALTWGVQVSSKAVTGQEWLPRDLNQGHIDYFFYALMVVMLANLGAFLAVAVKYQYKTVEHKRQLPPSSQAPEPGLGLPGASPGPAGLPPRPPGGASGPHRPSFQGPSTAPVTIGARPMGVPGQGGPSDDAAPDMEVYSRSLAYVPPSPNIPAPFR